MRPPLLRAKEHPLIRDEDAAIRAALERRGLVGRRAGRPERRGRPWAAGLYPADPSQRARNRR